LVNDRDQNIKSLRKLKYDSRICLYFYIHYFCRLCLSSRTASVIVSMLASSAVDCGFEHRLGQTKDDGICFCSFCLNTQHWRVQANIHLLWICTINMYYKYSTIRVGLVVVQSWHHHIIIILLSYFSQWYSWQIAHLALNNNDSLTHLYN
jgi:hypothetical protein